MNKFRKDKLNRKAEYVKDNNEHVLEIYVQTNCDIVISEE